MHLPDPGWSMSEGPLGDHMPHCPCGPATHLGKPPKPSERDADEEMRFFSWHGAEPPEAGRRGAVNCPAVRCAPRWTRAPARTSTQLGHGARGWRGAHTVSCFPHFPVSQSTQPSMSLTLQIVKYSVGLSSTHSSVFQAAHYQSL